MRLKSFYAKTMTEAMQMVRDTLGEDAVIVATREEKGGRAVRVTAAIDPSAYDEPAFEVGTGRAGKSPAGAEDWLQYDEEDEEYAVAEELTETLLRHGAPENVIDQVVSCATVVGLERPSVALVAAIEHLFHFRALPAGPQKRPLMMVGPPGAGKTLVAAKLAARNVMKGLKIGVITTDTVRAGGVQQLEAFTKILKTPLEKAESPADLAAAIEAFKNYDQVIIDSPGTNPFAREDIKTLARLIGAAEIEPLLALPAGGDADEAGEIAKIFGTLGVHTLVPTRLDTARRYGGLLSAAHHGSLAFSEAANTPKVAEGLFSLTPKTLAKLLMPAGFENTRAGGHTKKTAQG